MTARPARAAKSGIPGRAAKSGRPGPAAKSGIPGRAAKSGGPRLVLASSSPRRRELLASTGARVDVVSPEVDETPQVGELPSHYVERLALAKAEAVRDGGKDERVVLAADTIVALGSQLFGKPVNAGDAKRILRILSGITHEVHTGVAVVTRRAFRSAVATTHVSFRPLDDAELDWYIATGEPLDRAGAYAIQGGAALFVRSVEGSPSNVVGLPLTVVADLLTAVRHPLPTFRPPEEEQ
jgi:septum formation protein